MKLFLTRNGCIAGLLLLLLISCKRDTDLFIPENPEPVTPVIVNDGIQVIANLSGIIMDESNHPVQGAMVSSGTVSAITDTFGSFIFRNISLSKENGSVKVIKSGYFTAVRTFKTFAGKDHLVKIQLMEKQLSGTVPGTMGGIVTSNGGATISFPAGAFVKSNGDAYTGVVNVYSRWIDPTSPNLPYIIPGDLRGVRTDGSENILQTYGMVGAELEDASGNPLSISAGKMAEIIFPIPAILQSSAPDSILLWHFDNNTSRWKEEGIAIKSANKYSALVNRFSFWNCDVGINNFVQLDFTLVNNVTNAPLVGVLTRLKVASQNNYVYGFTNHAGYVGGAVIKDAPLVLEVMTGNCQTVIYTQQIGPFSANTSLGVIPVNISSSNYVTFTGTVVNCNSQRVDSGNIRLYSSGGNIAFVNTDTAGRFSFSLLKCTGGDLLYSYMVTDDSTSEQSNILTGIATSTNVDLDSIAACHTPLSASIYVAGSDAGVFQGIAKATVWKDGVPFVLSSSAYSYATDVYVSGNDVYVLGIEPHDGTARDHLKVWKNGAVLYMLDSAIQTATAYSIVVSDGDVYVTGTVDKIGKVWKNGNATLLPNTTGTGTDINALDIAVDGTDVYVAGSISTGLIYHKATLWKNGSIILSLASNESVFNSVFISGADVYLTGWQEDPNRKVAKVWKNGIATTIGDGTVPSQGNAILVSGSDIYVAGTINHPNYLSTDAVLWKNGIPTVLNTALSRAAAYGIVMKGNDIYVVGDQSTTTYSTAKVWKNYFPINLTGHNIDGYARGIFVK